MHKTLSFGTDGIRGDSRHCPALQPNFLQRLGRALCMAYKTESNPTPHIAIGRDTRASGIRIAQNLAQGIHAAGGIPYDAGILATPALQQLIQLSDAYFSIGIMITASHNPAHDNGIKFLTAHGKISETEQDQLATLFTTLDNTSAERTSTALESIPARYASRYTEKLRAQFPKTFLQGIRIALDTAHGSLSAYAASIFTAYGATVAMLGDRPTGHNINEQCGSTHPEALLAFMQRNHCDIGCAFDGDGDRLIMMTSSGQLRTGDDLLALLATHPHYNAKTTVVGTIMSNAGLESFLRSQGKSLLRTAVGDQHVWREMCAQQALLGGERSGHLICANFAPTADALYAALRALEALIIRQDLTWPTFPESPSTVRTVTVTTRHDLRLEPFSGILATAHAQLPHGRCIVRYSGTEPLLRIMVEDASIEHATHIADWIVHSLAPLLKGSSV